MNDVRFVECRTRKSNGVAEFRLELFTAGDDRRCKSNLAVGVIV